MNRIHAGTILISEANQGRDEASIKFSIQLVRI
jgi:hypothetical protein